MVGSGIRARSSAAVGIRRHGDTRGKKTKQNKRFIHDVERAAWDTINGMKGQGSVISESCVEQGKNREVGWAQSPTSHLTGSSHPCAMLAKKPQPR